MQRIDFEILHRELVEDLGLRSISHCDYLCVEPEVYKFVEVSRYTVRGLPHEKKLSDPVVFENEQIVLVKKMWGSFAIFLRLLERDGSFSPGVKRIFILKACIETSELARHLERIMERVSKFRNGAFEEVKLRLCASL